MDVQTHRPYDITDPHCMSCHVGDRCQFVNARFSSTGQYYIEECLGPGIPTYTLRHVHGDAATGYYSNHYVIIIIVITIVYIALCYASFFLHYFKNFNVKYVL